MPARIARSSTSAATPKNARNKNKKRSLDAYAQAQKLVPEKGPARHRLGEAIDDVPRQKRRRDDSEDDADEEEEPQRKRPNKRSLANDDDDDIEYGSDPDGNELTLGGIAEDDYDSDLDSDEAFGESDEERFEGFTFRGSKSGKGKAKGKKPVASSSKRRDIDLNEEDESEDDDGDSQDDEGLGFGDDAVDLAAMLDDDDEEMLGGKDTTGRDLGEESADETGDEEESESDDEEEDEDDEDAAKERSARMLDRFEALDGPARQAPAPKANEAVTVDDFMEDTDLVPEKAKGKKKAAKPTAIAAPLPKRQQDRLDREVATQKAKEQLDRWRDTVIRNRRAEFLNFPLQNPADQNGSLGEDKFMPSTQEKPQNELEESIQRIMEESGLAAKPGQKAEAGNEESALLKSEELAEKKLPIEEVMRRRAELRRARELLFREELKAKRIAKIKSKSYRRVHRKERERKAEQEREALEGMGIDPMDEDEKERADRKRAQARMDTKHKDSKWAKSIKQTNRAAWDDDARDGVIEQARRNEELKRRIAGHDVSDEGSDVSSEDDDDDQFMLKKLDEIEGDSSEPKGLAGLKFMRAAEERKKKQNDEDVERLRKEMAIADGDEEESEAEDQNLGRAVFGPQKKEKRAKAKEDRLEFEAPESADEDEEHEEEDEGVATKTYPKPDAKPKDKASAKPNGAVPPKGILKKSDKASGPLANGWLKEPAETTETVKNAWLKAPKGSSKKAAPVDVEIDTMQTVEPAKASAKSVTVEKSKHPAQSSTSKADNTNGWTTVTYNNGSDAEASDNETSDPVLNAQQQKQSLQQRAFAGDDVQAAFDAEKEDLAESEDEKEVSNHLPGWGSWTGGGLSKSTKKRNERAKHNPLHKTKVAGVKQADRKDAKLKNVIISERQDRKGKKYLASVLPHQYENQEQYERSHRLPMGPEWTTKEVHQRMTRPRVVVKPGVNMTPLERPAA